MTGSPKVRGAAALVGGIVVLCIPAPPGDPAPLVGPVAAAAQVPEPDPSARTGTVGGGVAFQTFRFRDAGATGMESVSLLTLPLAARVSVGNRVRGEVRANWARAVQGRPDGSSVSIAGLTDTEARISVDVVPDAVTLTGVALLPTGSEGHTREQVELAGAVAADLLPFRISHWGSGGAGGLSATFVHSFGATGVGAEVGYRRAGEFQPTDDPAVAYRPGDLLVATAAVDRVVGPAGKVTVRLDARRYGEDAVGGENLFRSGGRVGVTGSYSFPVGPAASGVVYAGYRHRSSGTFLLDLEPRPSQGNLLAGGAARFPSAGGVLVPTADLRVLRRGDGVSQGYILGVGSGAEWEVGGHDVVPSVRFRFGSVLVREEARSGFVGVEVGVQARTGGRW